MSDKQALDTKLAQNKELTSSELSSALLQAREIIKQYVSRLTNSQAGPDGFFVSPELTGKRDLVKILMHIDNRKITQETDLLNEINNLENPGKSNKQQSDGLKSCLQELRTILNSAIINIKQDLSSTFDPP